MGKKMMAMFLCVALLVTTIQGNNLPIVKAAAPTTLYDMATDTKLQNVVSGGAINSDVLTRSGSPSVTIAEDKQGEKSIRVSGRATSYDAVDIKRSSLPVDVAGEYTFTVTGHVENKDIGTKPRFVFAKSQGSNTWLVNLQSDDDGKFTLTYVVTYSEEDLAALDYNYRIQTGSDGDVDTFYIDSIVVTVVPSDNDNGGLPKTVYENAFDASLGDFTGAGSATVELSADKVASAGYSMKVTSGTAGGEGAQLPGNKTGMVLNGEYKITAKVYSSTEQQVVMQLNLGKVGGGTDYKWLCSPTLTADSWTEYTYTMKITSADYTDIKSLCFENKTGTGAFYVDDVKITKVADLTPPAEEDSKESMDDIDFENGQLNGFAGRGGSEVLTVTDEIAAHSGSYSLKTTNRAANWHAPQLNITNYVAQGKEYQITAWVHAKAPAAATTFKLSTQIGQGDGASYITLASGPVSPEGGWVQLTGKYRYTNTSSGFISIYVENSDAGAEYYIDDISLVELSSQIDVDLALPSLAEIYEDDFLIGNVFSSADLSGVRFDLLKHHFNVLTAENAMKPDALMKSKGVTSFTAVDEMVQTILNEGISVHGHTLGWHQQTSAWMNKDANGAPLSRAEAEENLKLYVSTVAEHYKEKVISWDVLNEAIADNPSNPTNWRSSLRLDSPWYLAFANGGGNGEEYIAMLFEAAREADPDAILYYNDYNLDNQNKATAVAAMVAEINANWNRKDGRLLIEGIGMQGHYNLNTIVDNVEKSIKRFGDIGVEVSITELDVTISGVSVNGPSEAQMLRQAAKYAQLFMVFKSHSNIIERVTIWGVDDASSWRSTQYPLLFNSDLSAKEAYYAIADPEGFLATYVEPAVTVQQGSAVYGKPIIDGNKDALWDKVQPLQIDQQLQAWQYPTGTARVMWDRNNLYVLLEVNNNSLDNTSPNPWEQSSVEVFVDEKNCKSGEYESDDGQYRVSYENLQTFGGSTNSNGFESRVTVSGTGYIVEMKIPFKTMKPWTGAKIGFDAQINHAAGGARSGVVMWSDTTAQSYQDTTQWGEIRLTGGNIGIQSDEEDYTYTTTNTTSEVATPAPASEKPNIAASANDPGDTTGEWKLDGNGWWYQKKDASYPADSWLKVNGQWYMFGKDGYMKTGWQQTADGSWFYFDDEKGSMSTGWKQTADGKWYFLDTMAGEMKTGWLKTESGKWYFLDTGLGEMKTGWLKTDDGKWYFLDTGLGEMKTGWLKTGDGKWYFLNEDGSCAMNTTTPDGHRVDENGAWVEE